MLLTNPCLEPPPRPSAPVPRVFRSPLEVPEPLHKALTRPPSVLLLLHHSPSEPVLNRLRPARGFRHAGSTTGRSNGARAEASCYRRSRGVVDLLLTGPPRRPTLVSLLRRRTRTLCLQRGRLDAGTTPPEPGAVNTPDGLLLEEKKQGRSLFLSKSISKVVFISSIQFEPVHWFVLKEKVESGGNAEPRPPHLFSYVSPVCMRLNI